jgi:hypothetical protein
MSFFSAIRADLGRCEPPDFLYPIAAYWPLPRMPRNYLKAISVYPLVLTRIILIVIIRLARH